MFTRIRTFLGEVRNELGKVTWPSRRQLARYTLIVIAIALFFALYLGAIDAFLTWVIGLVVR